MAKENKCRDRIVAEGHAAGIGYKIKINPEEIIHFPAQRLGIPKKIRFHATDEQEQKDIRHYFPGAGQVNLIPNFSAELRSGISPLKKVAGRLRCVFISRIMAIKNIQFFLELLGQVPTLFILNLASMGKWKMNPYWQDAQKIIEQLPAHIKVSYQGPLPHAEVIKTMGEFHLFVLPTTGENFGHAIFEALSAGRPVLISDRTPWHQLKSVGGLGSSPGKSESLAECIE